ncbi:hypothetical protein IAT38_006371 [Cryptococcus sp. DSM 104549]
MSSSTSSSSAPVVIPTSSTPPASTDTIDTAGASTSAGSPSPASLKLITSLKKLASYGNPGTSFKIKDEDIEWAARRWEDGVLGLTAEGSIKRRSQQNLRAKRSDGGAGERVAQEQQGAEMQNTAPHTTTAAIAASASSFITTLTSAGHTLTASASQISLSSLPSLASPSHSRTTSASSSVINTPFTPSTDLPEFTPPSSVSNSVADLLELGGADLENKGGSPATSLIGLRFSHADASGLEDKAEGALFVRKKRRAVEPMTPLRPVLEVAGSEVEEEAGEGEASAVESGVAAGHEVEEGGAEADLEDAGDDVSEAESWASAITRTPRRQLAHSLYVIPDDHPYAQDAHVSGWLRDDGDSTHVDPDSAEDGDDEDEEEANSEEEEDADVDGDLEDILSEEDFEGMDDEVEEADNLRQLPMASSPARSFSSSLFVAPGDSSDDDDEDAQDSRPASSDEESDLSSLIPVSPWAIQSSSTSSLTLSRPARSTSTPTPFSYAPLPRPHPRRLTLPPHSSHIGIHPSPPPSPQAIPAGPYPMFETTLPAYERYRPLPIRTPVLPISYRWEAVHLGGASGVSRTERDKKAEEEAKADEEWYWAEEAKLKAEEEDAARLRRHLEELGVYV